MPRTGKRWFKTLMLGTLLACLLWLFHPELGHFELLIDGEPVAHSIIGLAAIPALLCALGLIGIVVFLAALGVGVVIFLSVFAIAMVGILLVAPYSWPILLLFCLMLWVLSPNDRSDGND